MYKTQHLKLLLITVLTSLSYCFSVSAQSVNVSGILKKWHKITLTLTLPGGDLTESAATFRNRRMDVIFTDPTGKSIRVPGFFAAGGNAANATNNAATQGKIYKAYLRPYMTGNWTYRVLYYNGTDVALKNLNNLPAPQYNITGSITGIGTTDKALPDLRAKGRLEYQKTGTNSQRRYLRFAETGEYFLKLGPDSPENFLDYNEFDFAAPRNGCGLCTQHFFNPHAKDYKTGDPTWKGGKGKNIIGALNYLKEQKMNSISMSLFGGDDKNVFPWVNLGNKFVFDISKLEQWEIVLDHAEKKGLMLHFKLAENENWNALNNNQIRVYYREMVARFGHHLALEWNISEEYRGTAASAIPRIDFLASIDPWQNLRVIHTYPGEHSRYDDWLSLNAKLTGASIQSASFNNYSPVYAHPQSGILTIINKSKNAGTPWVVSSDEQNPGSTGVFTSKSINVSTVVQAARTRILWKTLIAGGAGVMWYGGGEGDFKTENFNRFSTLFTWTRYAILDFFKANNIEFWNMTNNDNLVSGSSATNHCLAEVGKSYVIYLENGGSTNLNLAGQTGNFTVRWFDPRNGGNLQIGSKNTVSGNGTVNIGNAPNAGSSDWVVLVTRQGTAPAGKVVPGRLQAEDFDNQSGVQTESTIDVGGGQNVGYINNGDFTEYNINAQNAGTYKLNFRVASATTGGKITIKSNGSKVGEVDITNTTDWQAWESKSVNVTLPAGEQTLRLDFSGTAFFLFNINYIDFTLTTPVTSNTTLSPINDAYLQGSTRVDNDLLRIENGKRVGYLMYDLSGINGTITSAKLVFNVTGDAGSGNLNIHQGTSNNWNENNLSNSNKPATGTLLGSLNTSYAIGNTKTIDLDASAISGNTLSLILTATSGNDFAIGTNENTSVAPAQLVITYTTGGNTRTTQAQLQFPAENQSLVYPNPVQNRLQVRGATGIGFIYNLQGQRFIKVNINENNRTIDVSSLKPGHYTLILDHAHFFNFIKK